MGSLGEPPAPPMETAEELEVEQLTTGDLVVDDETSALGPTRSSPRSPAAAWA